MIRRRWLQFSMRGLLIALTIGCLAIGFVEQARRRGRAIDELNAVAIVNYDAETAADDSILDLGLGDHFWLDLKRMPVNIVVHHPINRRIAQQIAQAQPIRNLEIFFKAGEISDEAVIPLRGLNDGCEIRIYAPPSMSEDAFDGLRNALPNSEIAILCQPYPFTPRFSRGLSMRATNGGSAAKGKR